MSILNRIYRRLYLFFTYFRLIKIYREHKTPHENHRPTVVFDFSKIPMNVYYYALLSFFEKQGYNLVLKKNFWFLANLFDTFRHIHYFKLQRLIISSKVERFANEHTLYFYDKESKLNLLNWKKRIRIGANVFPYLMDKIQLPEDTFILSFHIHPIILHFNKTRDFQKLRNTKRSISVAFSGHTVPALYDNTILNQTFSQLNRLQIIAHLKNSFLNQIYQITKKEDYDVLYHGKHSKIILRETGQPTPPDWLEFLSKTDFFLACPGVRMPICHNAIEAMSVGTILITSYNDFFYPPLEEGVNCLVFKDASDLEFKINQALNMSEEEIKILRVNTIKYYETFLSDSAVIDWINISDTSDLNILIQAEDISLQQYEQR